MSSDMSDAGRGDGLNLLDGVADFVVGRVEVGRDADAGTGAVIDEDFAAGEFLCDFFAVGDVEDDDTSAAFGFAAGADGEIGFVGEVHQAEIQIGYCIIMLADEMPGRGYRSPQSVDGATVGLVMKAQGH